MTCILNMCNIFLIYFSVRFHKIVSHIQVVLCISDFQLEAFYMEIMRECFPFE